MSPFAALAARQMCAPVKARRSAAQKRALAKVAEDGERLSRLWWAWRSDRREVILAGPHGDAARELLAFLATMTVEAGDALVALVTAGEWRGADTDADERFEILSMIDAALIAARECAALPPFNDPLPGASPDTFQKIRELLS